MKEILEIIIKNLVENEDQVSITENETEKEIVYEVRVADSDFGKVIGKQGKVAKSIRTLIKSIAGKEHKRVTVQFQD